MSVDEILEEESKHDYPHVSVTGGEPLIQEETPRLVEAFLDRGKTVVVETNGTRDISLLPDGAVKIMDIKCPSSGHSHEFQWENVWRLSRQDEVKFVCANRHDYEWARGIIRDRFEITKTKVLFSPVFGELPPRNLIEWILEDGLNVRFQLQIHKFIWPHDTRGV
jgi:7-carboxy-7-deazaguanine synthase